MIHFNTLYSISQESFEEVKNIASNEASSKLGADLLAFGKSQKGKAIIFCAVSGVIGMSLVYVFYRYFSSPAPQLPNNSSGLSDSNPAASLGERIRGETGETPAQLYAELADLPADEKLEVAMGLAFLNHIELGKESLIVETNDDTLQRRRLAAVIIALGSEAIRKMLLTGTIKKSSVLEHMLNSTGYFSGRVDLSIFTSHHVENTPKIDEADASNLCQYLKNCIDRNKSGIESQAIILKGEAITKAVYDACRQRIVACAKTPGGFSNIQAKELLSQLDKLNVKEEYSEEISEFTLDEDF